MGAGGGTAGAAAAVVATAAAGPISGVPAGETGAALTGVGLVAVGVAGAGIVAGTMAGAGAVSSTSRCSAVFDHRQAKSLSNLLSKPPVRMNTSEAQVAKMVTTIVMRRTRSGRRRVVAAQAGNAIASSGIDRM